MRLCQGLYHPYYEEDGCVCITYLQSRGTVIETRFGRVDANGVFDPLERLGGELRQDRGIGELRFCGLPAEVTPSIANVVGLRRTTSLSGLGLVDAVPDAALVLLAASQPAATRGTVNWLTDLASGKQRVGRFGWKNQVATLRTFAGDAYVNEMGITNPIFPDEVCPQGDCSKLGSFLATAAAPRRPDLIAGCRDPSSRWPGKAARDRYAALSSLQRSTIIAFLRSL